jgi:hypothetical protein
MNNMPVGDRKTVMINLDDHQQLARTCLNLATGCGAQSEKIRKAIADPSIPGHAVFLEALQVITDAVAMVLISIASVQRERAKMVKPAGLVLPMRS